MIYLFLRLDSFFFFFLRYVFDIMVMSISLPPIILFNFLPISSSLKYMLSLVLSICTEISVYRLATYQGAGP